MHQFKGNKKNTIVFIIDFLYTQDGLTGGTERQLIELLKNIDQQKFRSILVCLRKYPGTPGFDSISNENHILNVHSLASIKGIIVFLKFIHFLRNRSTDIIQTYFHDSTLFGIMAAWLAGIKTKVSCRRDLGFWYNSKLLRNLSLVNRFTDRILVNSHAVKKAVVYHEHFSPKKIDVIYNGLDNKAADNLPAADLKSEFPAIRDCDRIVGMVANFNRPVKRVDLFVEVADRVLKQHQDVRFLLVGGGSLEKDLQYVISRLDLNDKVILAGKKNPAMPYIKSFDVGILTSDSEGFSNVLLEYMAAGVPAVATDVGGNREIIQHGVTGLLVPPGDAKKLAEAILYLLKHDEIRKEMSHKARQQIEFKYDWKVKIKEYENYYLNLLEK